MGTGGMSSLQALEVDRPVFIVGPHRSGTTLLYTILSRHPDLGYFNRGNHRLPRFPRLAHGLTRLGSPDDPREAQRVWDFFWSGGDDVMDASDATDAVTRWYRRRVAEVLRLRGATRFLAKYPRLSLRLDWIDAVFPGALFLHVTRDWRGVVSSTVARKVKREGRGGGWFGVRIPGWRELGDVRHEVVAGRTFRFVTQTLEREGARRPGRFFRVGYEELCAAPVEVVRRIATDCDLRWTPDFEASIPRDLRAEDQKWRSRLDASVVAQIRAEDAEFFSRYEPGGP